VADVKPFVCCRPASECASEVAALPYDVFGRHEAAAEIARHPRSFLRIDKTAALFSDEVGEYDAQVYAKAAELFAADERAGVFIDEKDPHYFIYRLEKGGHAQTGIVACIAVDDYRSGVLKRHENTRALKLEDRVQHISALNAHTGPVLVTYRAHKAIDAAVAQATATTAPLYDFTAPDGVRHTAWRLDDEAACARIQSAFGTLEALYIADGHHRAAAAAELGRRRQGAAQHFLIVAFPSNQLEVLDYNRVVADTNGLSPDELLSRITEHFELAGSGPAPCKPQARGEFALYLDKTWYRLLVRDGLRPADPVGALDVSLLQDYLLAPILGIDDPRTDRRISYVGGVRGLAELQRRADAATGTRSTSTTGATGATTNAVGGVAFALYPCSIDELFRVADTGALMPPKSTWFEPKPRSGLFIHRI
jgi:uncharacterized protein (DUF1015 family)